MRKVYLFMLMAVGLLVSTTMSAMPERPVPPEPQAPEGVEMVKAEAPEMTIPEHQLPQAPRELRKIDLSKIENHNLPAKAPLNVMDDPEAKIGTKEYATLQEALNAANEGETVTLLKSVSTIYGYNINESIILDLGGNTITNNIDATSSYMEALYAILTNAENVTIRNGSIYVEYNYCYHSADDWDYSNGILVYSGKTTLENINSSVNSEETKGAGYAVCVYPEASLVTSGGNLEGLRFGLYNVGGVMTIKSGSVKAPYYSLYNENGKMYIEGGNIETTSCNENGYAYAVTNDGNGYVKISGGIITSTSGSSGTAIFNYNNAETEGNGIFITGGTITGKGNGVYNYYGTVDISGNTTITADTYGVYNQAKNTHCSIYGSAKVSATYYGIYNNGEASSAEIYGSSQIIVAQYYAVYNKGSKSYLKIYDEAQIRANGDTYGYGVYNEGADSYAQISGKAYVYGKVYGIRNYSNYSTAITTIDGGTIKGGKYGIYNMAKLEIKETNPDNPTTISGESSYGLFCYYREAILLGGTISNGVYVDYDPFKVQGGKITCDNNCFTVYVNKDGQFNVDNSTTGTPILIENTCTTSQYGSYAVYLNQSVAVLNSGTFRGNTSDLSLYSPKSLTIGGGIYQISHEGYEAEGMMWEQLPDKTWTVGMAQVKNLQTGKLYASFTTAVSEASPNDELKLLKDVEGPVTINKSVTLNMGLFTINGTLTADGAGTLVKVRGNGVINDFAETNDGNLDIYRVTSPVNPSAYKAEGCKVDYKDDKYIVLPQVAELNGTKYYSVTAAFAALPDNSTPSKVILLEDDYLDYEGICITLEKYHDVTLDLNGYTIFGLTEYPDKGTAIFVNKGTFTVMDSSDEGTGGIFNTCTNPEDWKAKGFEYPRFAYNIFSNYGTLIIESGYFESNLEVNNSNGEACYVVDNYTGGKLIVNGGTLSNKNTNAIRLWCTSTTISTDVIVNGGEIISPFAAILIHLPSNKPQEAPLASVTINGGKLTSPKDKNFLYTSSQGYLCTGVNVSINGGEMQGYLYLYYGTEKWSISGGVFDASYYSVLDNGNRKNITGGVFYSCTNYGNNDTYNYFKKYVDLTKYCIYEYADKECTQEYVDGTSIELWYKVAPCTEKTIETNTTITDPEEIKPSDIITVVGNENEKEPITLTIGDDKGTPVEVNVNTIQGDGEAQIVVKDGAILNVGNGGLVSKNDKLVFVKVEAGGKMTIGNKGLDQKGEIFPIIIEHDADKSGIYMVSPDAQMNTEPEATVRVYTRAYMTTALKHWQQLAIPVKNHFDGEVNKGITIKFDQLGGQKSSNPDHITTDFYRWTYNTDKWEFMKTFENEWTTEDLKPFEAYDLINNSLPSEKGVTYEFKGDLVGNKDLQLIFPEHGYCLFGNSYTAPISLDALFKTTKEYIQGDNIDYAVWIFNAAKDRYETVNEEQLKHPKMCPFTEIPPQEVFLMQLLVGNSGSTMVDYRKAIWDNQHSTTINRPILAPRDEFAEYNSIANIVVSTENDADHVLIMEGNQFDAEYNSGADASKYMDRGHFNFFASTNAGDLAILATDNLEGALFTLQTENAMDYTLSFNNVKADGYYMKDLLAGYLIPIQEGYEYSFVAQPNSTTQRFAIVREASAPTNMDIVKRVSSQKGVYTILGQYVGDKTKWEQLSAGVYVVDGIKMVK